MGIWVLAAAPVVWAEPAPGPGQEGGPEAGEAAPGHDFMAQLNLTDAQLAKLKTERLNMRKQMIRDTAEVKTLHLDLFAEITQDKPDLEKIEKLAKQIGDLEAKMLLARTKSIIFLRSQLTPEQKKKMDAMHLDRGFDDMERRHGQGQMNRKDENDEKKKP